jgi:tripartite-type tricarboxylate transporter receptor subunit TctC
MKNKPMTRKERRKFARLRGAVTTLMRVALFAVFGIAVLPAGAQNYPVKPVRLILPFAGGTDLVGRMLAAKLSPALGQQVVPDPRVGATGNIGYVAAAKSPPDGYALLMGAVPVLTNPHLNPKVGFDPLRDFAPIALLAIIPNVVVVHPSVPVKTLRELTTLARSHPGKIAYGSGGVGSANHLAAEFLQSLAKVRFVHVPYKSATFGLAGAMSGEVDMVIVVASSAVSYVKAGKMHALVVLDTKRLDTMPQVPTSAEAGMPQLVAVNWYALLAPAGTPSAIIERLNAESVKAMSAPDTRERLHAMGGEPNPGTPEQTAAFLRAEYARWGKVIRDAGIKPE